MGDRPVGLTKDVGWQIGVSRSMPVDIDVAWEFLTSTEGVELWLGSGVRPPLVVGQTYRTDEGTIGEFRSVRPRGRVRLTWQPSERDAPATVQIALAPSRTGCTFRFHTEHLASSDEREAMRAHWKRVADQIQSALID